VLSRNSAITSQWGQNPSNLPTQQGKRANPVTGYQQGVPTTYNGVVELNKSDNATLSAMPSIFNRVTLFGTIGGRMNKDKWYHARMSGLGTVTQNQAGDQTAFNNATVGGSTNGMQNGAGLQYAQGNGSTTPVPTGVLRQSIPPVPTVSTTKNYGNVASPGTPNVGRKGGSATNQQQNFVNNLISNPNWIVVAIGSAIVFVLVVKYVKV